VLLLKIQVIWDIIPYGLVNSYILKVLASFETVTVYQSAWHNISEDLNLQHVHIFSWD
jgi:hypothetical protein